MKGRAPDRSEGRDEEEPQGTREGTDDPRDGDGARRLSEARDLVRRGRVGDAVALFREIVAEHPGNLKARNNLGVLYDELGRHEEALEEFEAARALDPDNVEVLANLAGALVGLARFDEAERELRRALRMQPDSVQARAHLGMLYFRRGQYVHAETELGWVCERDADHGAAHFYRGEALNRLGRVDEAIEVLERAAVLQPRNARVFHTLGILFDRKNMPGEATRMHRKARELSR